MNNKMNRNPTSGSTRPYQTEAIRCQAMLQLT